jgi:hypothetical protein
MIVNCFTSATFSYIDRARVLARSIREMHPDWIIWICVADQKPTGIDGDWNEENLFDRVVTLEDLSIPNLESWIFRHGLVELCTAVKGHMLCKMLQAGAEKVIYLDPDIAVFSPLSEAVEVLEENSIVLTPHQIEPEREQSAIMDNEIGSLKHGIYNLGFLGVSSRPQGRNFAHWWRDRLCDYCYDDIPNGLFTDQRWCDLVPAFFDDTVILRHPGYNVASWNLSNRPVAIAADGAILAANAPLRFFHFTKINSIGEVMLTRYAGQQHAVYELLYWYRRRLAAERLEGLPDGWWAYARFVDGSPITPEHRLLYRQRADLSERFPDPFQSGPNSYQQWYSTNIANQ